MPILFGISAALFWGAADFLARFSSRRIGAFRSLFYMQIVGVAAATIWLAAKRGFSSGLANQPPQVWMWAALVGVLSVLATLAFYRALQIGTLSIVSPVCSAYPALTVALSILAGEKLTAQHAAGMVLAVVGVALAATSFNSKVPPASNAAIPNSAPAVGEKKSHLSRGVGLALLASVIYGVNFLIIGYKLMPHIGGLISVWSSRSVGIFAQLVLSFPARQSLRLPEIKIWPLIAAIGVLDAGAYLASNLGLATGHISLVTVLGSLFSAVTVFLAWAVLRERLQASQWLGIGLIFAAIVLVSV